MPTGRVTYIFNNSDNVSLSGNSGDISADTPFGGEYAVTGANVEADIGIRSAGLKIFFLLSDKGGTLKTNSSSAPDDTITFVAGIPFVWTSVGGGTNPIVTATVTKIFLTNTGGGTATVQIRGLVDATP